MDMDIITKLKTINEKCTKAIGKIEFLKQQSTQFLSDSYATGQPLFSQHNYKKIDDQLSKLLEELDKIISKNFALHDEHFSYAIPHHPKEIPAADQSNCPVYEMEHVEGDKPWLFMLKYKKDQRWKILKKSLMKNLSDNLLLPYERTPDPGSHVLFAERSRVSRGLILQILSPQPDRVASVKLLDVDSNAIKFVASNKLYHVNLIAASVHSQILHCCLESDFDASLWPAELNNIFANALRDSALRVTLLGKHIDEDIENTFVPSYSVKILAQKTEENIVIDINEWILNHVYPALEGSNGSFHSIDLNIFDPYQYSLCDSDCSEFRNEDAEDRLTDFDEIQTEVMSVVSERTIRDEAERASTPISFVKKTAGLSPLAAEFTLNASVPCSDISKSSTKQEIEDKGKDFAACLEKALNPGIIFENVLDRVFSQDECEGTASCVSDQDERIKCSAVKGKKPETQPQDGEGEMTSQLKVTNAKPKASNVLEGEKVTNKSGGSSADKMPLCTVNTEVVTSKSEDSSAGQISSDQVFFEPETITKKSVDTSKEKESFNGVNTEVKHLKKKLTDSNEELSLKSDKNDKAPVTSVTHGNPTPTQSRPSSAMGPNFSPNMNPDPLLYSRPPSAGPPGFNQFRPVPQYQPYPPASHPQSLMRPPVYGMPNTYQGPNIYMANHYPNQAFCNTPFAYSHNHPTNYNMTYYPQQRFNPPLINPQQIYNPLVTNPPRPPHQQILPPQPLRPSQTFTPMGTNQNFKNDKQVPETNKTTSGSSTAKATTCKVSERIVENKRRQSNTSIDSKDSVPPATSPSLDGIKTENVNSSSASEPVSQSKWSANDYDAAPVVTSAFKSSSLAKTEPVLSLPFAKNCWDKNDELIGQLTYYFSPHHFYLRLDDTSNDFVGLLAREMFEFYSDPKNCNSYKSREEVKSAVGKYAACLWLADGHWYRVEITNWNSEGEDEDTICVFYVDYGNIENVKWTSLQPLMKDFSNYEKMTTRCSLVNIKPVDSTDWEAPVHEFFQSLFDPVLAFVVKVEARFNPEESEILAVDLICEEKYENKTICDILVENKHARYEETEESLYSGIDPMGEDYRSVRNSYEIDTDDACQAVSGYKPKDDSRICPFFARDGHCWKNKRCNQEHVRLNPDVFTTDKTTAYTAALNNLEAPLCNSEITISVNEIVSLNRFFAQLPPSMTRLSLGDNKYMTFVDLANVLNDKTTKKLYKHLFVGPAAGEMVMAKHDDIWYRARVVGPENAQGIVQVFFVDCGSTANIPIEDLRQIEPSYLRLPFQAVECIIANIYPKDLDKSTYDDGYSYLSDLLYETNPKPLIKVIGATAGDILSLEVLVKSRDHDVGEFLIEAGYCEFKEIVSTKSLALKIPG